MAVEVELFLSKEDSSGGGNIVFFLDLEPNPETPVCSLDRGFREGPVDVAACAVPDNDSSSNIDSDSNNINENRKSSIGLYRRANFLMVLLLAVLDAGRYQEDLRALGG